MGAALHVRDEERCAGDQETIGGLIRLLSGHQDLVSEEGRRCRAAARLTSAAITTRPICIFLPFRPWGRTEGRRGGIGEAIKTAAA